MRVLTVGNLYPPHHFGGYERIWQAAVRELRRAGHEVRVLATDHRNDGVDAAEDADVHRELRWYWRDHEFPRRSARARLAIERRNRETFDRHIEDFRPDVLSWWAMGGLSLSLLRRSALPAVGWIGDDWLVYGPLVDAGGRLLRRRPRLETAARWVFISEALRDSMLRRLPGLADIAVEPVGVAPEFTARPEQSWNGRLLYMGRLDPRKGIDTAIGALSHLPGATLRVDGGGDPAELDRLRALTDRLGLEERVTFAATADKAALPDVYAAADVTVFPVTWFEPFGLVPLESMAVGRPVIATGTGGSGDYLRHEENCLLFDPGDAAGLAAAIRRLAGDPALRTQLREGGFATAAELTEARWLDAVRREHERLSP